MAFLFTPLTQQVIFALSGTATSRGWRWGVGTVAWGWVTSSWRSLASHTALDRQKRRAKAPKIQ
jgi:hypothetical protein